MKIFFFRLLFLLFLALFQLSFFDILFPFLGTPIIILVAVVIWVLVEGFFPSLRMIVPLALLFELFSSETIGALSLYAVLLAYATSFFSKRVVIDSQGFGLFGYALFAALGAWGYRFFETLFFHQASPLLVFSFGNLFWILFLGIVFFFFLHFLIQRFEKSIDRSEQNNMRNIR
ncbi:MAG: hypothetical protein AAB615_02300 [Patescibacteria group bacterium]